MTTSEIPLRRSGALPVEYSSFVDHRAQLAAARTSLGQTRLLTLIGAGGVGKTRFAVRLAQSVRRLYPDGCWFIDLSGVGPAGSVVDEIGRILGAAGAGDPTEALVTFFGERRGLLVLDNCEHVLEQCAALIPRVLAGCPGTSVIATSRELLRIAAETVFTVDPLDADLGNRAAPAVELFLDRCATYLQDPTPAELDAISEICRRLDGLPLAIELAAARVRVLSPQQILDRLAEPLALLTGGVRDLPDRQKTIRAAISWSYELCTEAERAMWRRMSVFVGGWDLDAAEWSCHDSKGDSAALDLVQSLLEKSVITRRPANGVVYYDMLETVRQFGLEQCTPEELDAARARLRDRYLAQLAKLEAEWIGANQAYWLAMARAELPNIRAALEYCLESHDDVRAAKLLARGWRVVWQAQGRFYEFGRWIARIFERGIPQTIEGAQLQSVRATFDALRGDVAEADRKLAEADELAERLGDIPTSAYVLMARAFSRVEPDSLRLIHRALELQDGVNRYPARGNLDESVAVFLERLGHFDEAATNRERLIAHALRSGESYETAYLLFLTGRSMLGRGALADATRMFRQALSLRQNLEDSYGIAEVEEALAAVAARESDYVRSATLLGMTDMVGGSAGVIASSHPGVGRFRQDIETAATAALGTRAYAAAFAEGRSFTEADGIAFALGARLRTRPATAVRGSAPVLSAREGQVAALVGQGLTDRQIADRLVISRRTAEGHVANSLSKLGFTSRTQLAAWSATLGDGGGVSPQERASGRDSGMSGPGLSPQ